MTKMCNAKDSDVGDGSDEVADVSSPGFRSSGRRRARLAPAIWQRAEWHRASPDLVR